MPKKRLFVLASGTATGGGSGFENLVAKQHGYDYQVVAVASNHARGGVHERATRLKIPFLYAMPPWTSDVYRHLLGETDAEFVACSGWLKPIRGLDPATTFNIHPGPLPQFGGRGMYGRHVHEAVYAAYARSQLTHTAICMHFVTEEYDQGPVFFRLNIPILQFDTPASLGRRVNALEHDWQPTITNLVVTREIHWSGRQDDPVAYPREYRRVRWAPDE